MALCNAYDLCEPGLVRTPCEPRAGPSAESEGRGSVGRAGAPGHSQAIARLYLLPECDDAAAARLRARASAGRTPNLFVERSLAQAFARSQPQPPLGNALTQLKPQEQGKGSLTRVIKYRLALAGVPLSKECRFGLDLCLRRERFPRYRYVWYHLNTDVKGKERLKHNV